MKYLAAYYYKGSKHHLQNYVDKIQDFEEDFKRHTKEGSELIYVLFSKLENN